MKTLVDNGRAWTHDALCADLARWLQCDGFVANQIRFGSAWLQNASIPDVMKVRKSYTRWDVQIYEVKAYRSDFQAEIRGGKWRDYLSMSSRLYFASPAEGVINDVSEVPEACGWTARGPQGWRTRKTPRIREFTPDPDQLLALLMSVDDDLRHALRDLNAEKARKHRVNKAKNLALWSKMRHRESAVTESWGLRKKLVLARQVFEKVTGLSVSIWDFPDKLENMLNAAKHGVEPTQFRAGIHAIVNELSKLIDLVPDTSAQAIARINVVNRWQEEHVENTPWTP